MFGRKCQLWAKFGRFWAENPFFCGGWTKTFCILLSGNYHCPDPHLVADIFKVCSIPHVDNSFTYDLERGVGCIKASLDQIFRQSFIRCCLPFQGCLKIGCVPGDCQFHQTNSFWLRWPGSQITTRSGFCSVRAVSWATGPHSGRRTQYNNNLQVFLLSIVLSSFSIVQDKLWVVTFPATLMQQFDPSCAICFNHICIRQEHLCSNMGHFRSSQKR